MPFEPRLPPRVPVLPVSVDPTGQCGPTRAQVRGSHWRRVGYNAHVPAEVDGSVPEQRIAEAAVILGEQGGVTAWGGLLLAGASYFAGFTTAPVVLALGQVPGRRTPPGTLLSYEPLDCRVFDVHGVPIVEPGRALFDEVRRLDDWREGVVAADMTFAAGLTSLARLTGVHAEHRDWRRATRVPPVLTHASEHALSPQETRLRLVWTVDAGLPTPHVNRTLRTPDGRFICVPDLFDEDAGLVIEYDGEEHSRTRRRASDALRHDRCRDVGLEYCVVTAPDMRRRDSLVARLRAARQRAPFVAREQRRWVVAPRTEESLDVLLDQREAVAGHWRRRGVSLPPW